jgi:hypothetical protein
MTEFTRRRVLTGGAVATAATAVAHSPAAAADGDMDAFLTLSAALTGIAKGRLSPFVDVMNVKQTYFDKAAQDPSFDKLIGIVKQHASDPNLGDIVLNQSGDDVKFLARNILIAWYLGAWCDTAWLRAHANKSPPPGSEAVQFEVLTANAYTQGWAWRVGQAHPMGYSELRFGYWNAPPPPIDKFIA